jgi:hypothetical protein
MATLTINIDLDNTAFDGCDEGNETARILQKLQREYATCDRLPALVVLRDYSGNTVGGAIVKR